MNRRGASRHLAASRGLRQSYPTLNFPLESFGQRIQFLCVSPASPRAHVEVRTLARWQPAPRSFIEKIRSKHARPKPPGRGQGDSKKRTSGMPSGDMKSAENEKKGIRAGTGNVSVCG